MSSNLISIKTFLGKYYPELFYSAAQDKYKDSKLDSFFEQRFYIQNNKVQMIIDPTMEGLSVTVFGNEIHVSKTLFDHPNVSIVNSMETQDQGSNPRGLYNSEIYSTVAYLVCHNHTTFQITGEIDEPIYVRYRSDYETYYNSVLVFNISNVESIEIIEEMESLCALNSVINYIIGDNAHLLLTTFYQNHVSAVSQLYRNVVARNNSQFTHVLLGRGATSIVDETRLRTMKGAKSEMLGIVNSDNSHFHSILHAEPLDQDFNLSVVYKDVLRNNAAVSFFPVMSTTIPVDDLATIEVSNIDITSTPDENRHAEIKTYIVDILDRAVLENTQGAERYYKNKVKFLNFL